MPAWRVSPEGALPSGVARRCAERLRSAERDGGENTGWARGKRKPRASIGRRVPCARRKRQPMDTPQRLPSPKCAMLLLACGLEKLRDQAACALRINALKV